MFLRYWLPITVEAHPLGDLGFAYFLAFREIVGAEIRILPSEWPIGTSQYQNMYVGRWGPYSAYAMSVVPLTYINVVLGSPGVYSGRHTAQSFVENLALVAKVRSGQDYSVLTKYQYVFAHTEEDQTLLALQNVESQVVGPEAGAIRKALGL